MTEPEAPDLTIEKLVGVYRVLIPHKIAAYTYHLNNTSTITDAPTIRSLKFALQDEFEDWRDGEMLIQSLIETDEEVDRAARASGPAREAHAGRGRHRRPRLHRHAAGTTRGGSSVMRKSFPVEELARDPRFVRVEMRERLADPRPRPTAGEGKRNNNRLVPQRPDAPDAARALMHGIFVGEIQALEGAGRTCWDLRLATPTTRPRSR